jgi:hypothetical protein
MRGDQAEAGHGYQEQGDFEGHHGNLFLKRVRVGDVSLFSP